MKYERLFSEANIGALTVKNRIVMTAMGVGVAEYDGSAGDRAVAYYAERAQGGAGLIITEVTRVNNRHGVASSGQLAMNHDRYIEPFRKLVDAVHAHGAKLFCQLHHPGRQNMAMLITWWRMNEWIGRHWKGYWDLLFTLSGRTKLEDLENPLLQKMTNLFSRAVVAPSAIPCGLGVSPVTGQKTRALKVGEIKELVSQFAQAAKRVQAAGADGIELHAAHGYLLQEFLSPYTNRRTDEYGGSRENRLRFLKEIILAIRAACGQSFPVIVRLSVDEFYAAIGLPHTGIELEEGVELARELEKIGIDAIDVSSGSYETLNHLVEPASFAPGWRKYLAQAVKEAVHIPVIAANLIRSPEQAEEQLRSGIQDFIGLGRPLLADAFWPSKAAQDRAADIQRCICCLVCFESVIANGIKGLPCECAVNPRACREIDFPLDLKKDGRGRTVAIAGAGPAGLMAARVLGERGFKPVVFERQPHCGGQLRLGNKPPHKDKITWVIEDLEGAARRHGAEIRLGTEATPENISALAPYAFIDATGGTAIRPPIRGADAEHVCTVTPILDGSLALTGQTVAVIGSGMTGLETAELLAVQGNEVLVVEMEKKLAPGTWRQHTGDILPRLQALGVRFVTGRRLVEIRPEAIVLEVLGSKQKEVFAADRVVLSVGVRSNNLADAIRPYVPAVYSIGDAFRVGRIAHAVHSAYKTAREL